MATALCPRFDELSYCIATVHGSAPELRGTLGVWLGLASGHALKPVVVKGGTLANEFRECAVDTLEVTSGAFAHPVEFTLDVVAAPSPPVENSTDDLKGSLAPKVIKQLVRAHFPRFAVCFEQADLAGTVSVKFEIEETGAVKNVEINEAATSIPDAKVRECVRDAYRRIHFPRPSGGKVTVTYPIEFSTKG